VESDGEGDDLADSEQRSEDDSDLGSLKDFLAGSSSPVTKRKVPSTRSSSPPSRSNCQAYELSRVTATQDTNDDMPDIAEIVGMKARTISRTLIEDSDGDNLEPMAGRRDRRRKVIEDDSDY
jgi:hypothetical protein